MQRAFHRLRFIWLYFRGRPRWDTGITPPEVVQFMQSHPPGRALDLGCGTGTNLVAMARAGWDVVGVDFVPSAVRRARERIAAQELVERAVARQGDVTRLDDLEPGFDWILDIGCYHGLPDGRREAYRAGLRRLLAPGGTYLLYAMNRNGGGGPSGVNAEELGTWDAEFRLIHRTSSFDPNGRQSFWSEWIK